MFATTQAFHLSITYPFACFVLLRMHDSPNRKPLIGSGRPNIVGHGLIAFQCDTSPISANLTEQAMFDGILFRCPRWPVADYNR